ncbi:hypothetical protein V6N12_035301 [Hibiscus sabdariffa]|uniref:Uncharacterized protein n=1 Tax=Hibiscus sabdariffa TaxID=183260 RepID=A0ABR2BSJ6_9ROSI
MGIIVFPCSSTFLLPHLLIFALFISAKALLKMPENQTMPAVIVFGDSIVDAGNNNDIQTIIKCNFPPYGRDFDGGVPTGRFCNGKIPSDLIGSDDIANTYFVLRARKLQYDIPAYTDLMVNSAVEFLKVLKLQIKDVVEPET